MFHRSGAARVKGSRLTAPANTSDKSSSKQALEMAPLVAAGSGAADAGGGKRAQAAARARRWLVVDQNGGSSLITTSKMQDISTHVGVQLQLRDLRLLDPLLATSYPSAILTRNDALIANLGVIKLIVTTEKVFLTNLEDETVAGFATELCRRLSDAAKQRAQEATAAAAQPAAGAPLSWQGMVPAPGQLVLPFELQVLEAALETACARLEQQAAELEAEANPVLDSLTAEVNQGSLENERRVKNKLVRLTTRVETLKEVLEKLLDDEDDMRDMNLSAVAAERLAVATRRATLLEGRSGDVTPHPQLSARERTGAWVGAAAGQAAAGGWESEGLASASRTPAWAGSSASSVSSSEWEDAAVEVVEALLQSFFFSVDGLYDKLKQLQEYVEDTEDLVAMQLDNARNGLVRLDMVLTCVNSSVSLSIAVATMFSMNLQQGSDWASNLNEAGEPQDQGPYWQFVLISCICGGATILIFAGVMAFARWRRLI